MEFDLKGFLSGAIDKIGELFNELFEMVILLLPTSPFKDIKLDSIFLDFLGYFNYYVPMAELLNIMSAWLGCIVIYYSYQLVLRQIKAVS